jgi:hypothetical protein
MKSFETDARIGPDGLLKLDHLPFADGEEVHVRIEPKPVDAGKPRRLGLHPGTATMADDFDAPLPDSFWLGEDSGDEAPA